MSIKELINNSFNHKILIPKIIAEIGVHHNGDINLAKKYIEFAKEGGADAVKFQTYKASSLTTKAAKSYWDLKKNPIDTQFKLFSQNDKFWKREFEILKTFSDNNDIEFLSTPFDFESAKFLNDLMDVFKISSSDLNNKPFIEYISSFNKPIILSTGASLIKEIEDSISWIEKKSDIRYCLMHCVLNYPTLNKHANLSRIKILKNKFKKALIGYSDHTLPIENLDVLISSYILGAKIIEKHFTLNKLENGNDHFHSIDINDLKFLRKKLNLISEILGTGNDEIEIQKISRENARRSCVSNKEIKKGQVITYEMLTFKRPGTGIPPKDAYKIIGKKSKITIKEDTTIIQEMIEL